MKKAILWLFVFVLFAGCTESVQKQEAMLEAPESVSVPPITLNEYIIGPGDVLQVQVWRHSDFSATVKVQPNGMVSFPLVGDIEVKNMGLFEFRDLFAKKLDKYIVDPQVIIQVTLSMSNKVYVLGEVRKPGIYSLDEPRTISEAISHAGGFTYNAKKQGVVLMRKGADGVTTKPVAFDIDMIMNGEEPEKDVYLQRGDVVYVPLSNVALVDRFFYHLNTALSGVLGTQQAVINYPAVENVTSGQYRDQGQTQTQTIIVPITAP